MMLMAVETCSNLAASDAASQRWRQEFIRTYLDALPSLMSLL